MRIDESNQGAPGADAERPAPSASGTERTAHPRRALRGGITAWAQALVMFLVILCAGIWLGGHPGHLPGFLREAFEANHNSQVSAEALETIAQDYYRPVNRASLSSASIAGAVASLDDPFSHYLSSSEYHNFASAGSFSGVGMEAMGVRQGLRIEHVFDASPAARVGLKIGEVIVAVNGRSLDGVAEEAAVKLIRGKAGTSVALTVIGSAGRRTLHVTRAVINDPVVASAISDQAAHKIGVVYLASFSDGSSVEMREAVVRLLHEGAQGLILDLRHNGGGLVSEARLIASLFIEKGVIVTMRSRTQPPLTLTATGEAPAGRIPMVVLVDRDTASASEILTAALQDHHRATVVGTHTFGKGVFQELLPLSNGGALDITVGEYFTPNGRNLGGGGVKQGAGVSPEIAVSEKEVDGEGGVHAALKAVLAKLR